MYMLAARGGSIKRAPKRTFDLRHVVAHAVGASISIGFVALSNANDKAMATATSASMRPVDLALSNLRPPADVRPKALGLTRTDEVPADIPVEQPTYFRLVATSKPPPRRLG
jgi:hypothetical protein